jgi:hypothetical protein
VHPSVHPTPIAAGWSVREFNGLSLQIGPRKSNTLSRAPQLEFHIGRFSRRYFYGEPQHSDGEDWPHINLVGTVLSLHGIDDFVPGNGSAKLGDVLHRLDEPSLTTLVREWAAGRSIPGV